MTSFQKPGRMPQNQKKWGITEMDRRIMRTKKAIQRAYFQLLKEKGEEKITVTDIAKEADIDRKTFYLHYESTDQIIREFAETKTKEMLLRLTVKSFFLRSFDKGIFAREANAMLKEHLELGKILANNPNMGFFWSQLQDTSVEMLVEIYSRHSRLPKSDLTIQVSFFVAGAASVYQRWLRDEIPCTLEQLGEKVSEIAFSGAQSLLKNNGSKKGIDET